jgi:DNA-binding transcriptional MerR regulator
VGPGLPISVVANQLGVDPATLRAWHRRYGLGASTRSPGGHRRYTRQDVHRLREMRELVAAGVTPAEAARVVLAEAEEDHLPPARPSHADAAPLPLFHLDPGRLQQAALALDGPTIADLLCRGLATHGSCLTWELLVRPALRAVDSCHMSQAHRIAAEHLLSHFVSTTFIAHASRFDHDEPPPGRGPVLLACAPADQHNLPLTALAATLAEAHIQVDVLGPRTPKPALAATVAATNPSVVLVLALHKPAAELSVFDQPRRDTTWIAAGTGWANRELPRGVAFVDGLDPATNLIEATRTAPAHRR